MTARGWARTGLAIGVSAVIGWAGWERVRPRPTLDPIIRLLQTDRQDEAEAQLRRLLDRDPDNARGHMLLASIELDRLERNHVGDDRLARDALAHIERVATSDKDRGAGARVIEGKLCQRLGQFDRAEAAFNSALQADPTSDAGWLLLNLYDVQARRSEGRALARRLYRINPKPDIKRAALAELVREEIHQPAAAGLIAELAPIVEANPGEFQSRLALGTALAKEGFPDKGLALLRVAVEQRPDAPAAWHALLTALENAGQVDALQSALAKARTHVSDESTLARFQGWLAQERGDWPGAVAAYRRALEGDAHDPKLSYRLSRVLRLAGKEAEAARVEEQVRAYDSSRKELRRLYESHEAEFRDGRPHPELFQQIAGLRERMGYPEEARGWHALVLRDDPGNAVSLAAVERLK